MATLEVRGLSRVEGGRMALDGVSLSVESGQFTVLYGPDGAGKTTLLRAIAGLDRPDAGDVLLNGTSVVHWPPHRRGVGMVFQDLALFEGRTVWENVAYGLRTTGYPRREYARRVAEVLRMVDADGLQDLPVDRLTADQQQRVAIARTLAPMVSRSPLVLLLDEPIEHIAPRDRAAFRDRLRDIVVDLGITTLLATRDLDDAFALAQDLIVLDEGRVLQSGPLWRVLHGPSSVRAAELFGYATLIEGETSNGRIVEPGVGTLAYPPGFPLERQALALAHPSALLAVPVDSGLGCGIEGSIARIRAYGPTWVLDVRLGNRLMEVRWEWDVAPPPLDQPVAIAVRPDTLRFFNASRAGAPPSTTPPPRREPAPGPPPPVTEEPEPLPTAEEVAPTSDLDAVEVAPVPAPEPPPSVAASRIEAPSSITPAARPPRIATFEAAPPSPAPAPPRTQPRPEPADGDAPERTWSPPPSSSADTHHRGMPLD